MFARKPITTALVGAGAFALGSRVCTRAAARRALRRIAWKHTNTMVATHLRGTQDALSKRLAVFPRPVSVGPAGWRRARSTSDRTNGSTGKADAGQEMSAVSPSTAASEPS
jgi:hypothetical protein